MRRAAVACAAAVFVALPAVSQECDISRATYAQPGTTWTLAFSPVPRESAANQVNAFTIAIPGSDPARVISGNIYVPNGASPNWGTMTVPCGADGAVDCTPWEGTAYALVGDGIVPLPHQGDTAPAQVLFPGFSANVWYSEYRGALLGENEAMGDVFTFQGCAS